MIKIIGTNHFMSKEEIEKIKEYFRKRYKEGKGSWAENHDMAMDLIYGELESKEEKK